jgi:hypothetical protein
MTLSFLPLANPVSPASAFGIRKISYRWSRSSPAFPSYAYRPLRFILLLSSKSLIWKTMPLQSSRDFLMIISTLVNGILPMIIFFYRLLAFKKHKSCPLKTVKLPRPGKWSLPTSATAENFRLFKLQDGGSLPRRWVPNFFFLIWRKNLFDERLSNHYICCKKFYILEMTSFYIFCTLTSDNSHCSSSQSTV